MKESLTEQLPPVRVTPTTKQRLDAYVQRSKLTTNTSDHVRLAIEEYLNCYAPQPADAKDKFVRQ